MSGEHLSEEPQDQRGAPGSRDTGSDAPSGGPADRPSGTYRGDESVPAHSDQSAAEQTGSEKTGSEKTEAPPSDAPPAVPPYEDRQTTAKPDTGDLGGAVKPVTEGN